MTIQEEATYSVQSARGFVASHQDESPEAATVIGSLCALIERLAAALPVWRPLVDAPKDGRALMLWIVNHNEGSHCFAPVSITSDGQWWDDSTGDQIEPINGATHFCALPPPPTTEPKT